MYESMRNEQKTITSALEQDLILVNSVICHYGVPGQEWYKNKADRYQPHAKYAMGRPNPKAGSKRSHDEMRKLSMAEVAATELKNKGKWKSLDGDASKHTKEQTVAVVKSYVNELKAIKRGLPGSKDLNNAFNPDITNEKNVALPTVPHKVLSIGPLSIRANLLTVHVNGVPIMLATTFNTGVRMLDDIRARLKRNKEAVDERTGFHIKTDKNNSVAKDSAMVNTYHNTLVDRAELNALACISTMEMRQRGYDVYVKHKIFETYRKGNQSKIENQFKGAKIKPVKDGDIKTALAKQPEGSRGAFFFNWKFSPLSGHCFYYTVKNGKITVTDPQSGNTFTNPLNSSTLSKIFSNASSAQHVRLDNHDFDLAAIKEVVW